MYFGTIFAMKHAKKEAKEEVNISVSIYSIPKNTCGPNDDTVLPLFSKEKNNKIPLHIIQ